jgi:sec-independent protein translocase protein TatA
MAGLTPAHLLLILFIALIVIGPGKLPEVGSAIGKSVREFQKATGQAQETLAGSTTHQTLPQQPAQQLPALAVALAQPVSAAQPITKQPLPEAPSTATPPGIAGLDGAAQSGTAAQVR